MVVDLTTPPARAYVVRRYEQLGECEGDNEGFEGPLTSCHPLSAALGFAADSRLSGDPESQIVAAAGQDAFTASLVVSLELFVNLTRAPAPPDRRRGL